MKKIIFTLLAFTSTLAATAQDYKITCDKDTTVKVKISGATLSKRDVRFITYDYTSKDADAKPVTISGVILAPKDVVDGSVPCDGVILFNHHTLRDASQSPSLGGSGLDLPVGIVANPLRPNYIIVTSDFIGFGSSSNRLQAYLCGDINARNSIDGLVVARHLLQDKHIPLGKYQFNIGFSQGGSETMWVAKLRDTEYQDIHFDKHFAGGGPTDLVKAYEEYVENDKCGMTAAVALMLVCINENLHLGIDYNDLFLEPYASATKEWIRTGDYNIVRQSGLASLESLSQFIQPTYLNMRSEEAKALKAKLQEINLTTGWEPDTTQHYFVCHSRHDQIVPIQCGRAIIPWMQEHGFTASLVPGKTNLQTNTVVFKLNHVQTGAVWFVQTMAAIQFWPVAYYEGGLNRYYQDVVKDLNLIKIIHFFESIGIDLRKIIKDAQNAAPGVWEEASKGNVYAKEKAKASFFDVLIKLQNALAKVNLTITDVIEMMTDAGITPNDITEVYEYLTTTEAAAPAETVTIGEHIEVPLYLLRQYEQTLADWLLQAGIDVHYDQWGWEE